MIYVANKFFKFTLCVVMFLVALNVRAEGNKKINESSRPKIKVKIKYDYTYDDIANYLYSFNNHRLVLIAHCESFDFKHNKYGIRVWGDSGKAYGLFQFHYKTFMEFANRAGMRHPHWKNPYQQIYIANWMISHGYIKRWSCDGILKRYHRL